MASALALSACEQPLNDPYPHTDADKNIYYSSFIEAPKSLDPARAYTINELQFIMQIYEPPLQYHYLKRPYVIEPLTTVALPTITHLDGADQVLPEEASNEEIVSSVYTFEIKPGIYYQPHPAFAQNEAGQYYYHQLNEKILEEEDIKTLTDFEHEGTRELIAEDYVYQIKRLADPRAQSPIFGFMSEYIIGLEAHGKLLNKQLAEDESQQQRTRFFDLRQYPLEGVKVLDKYRYQIKIKGQYPQLIYWLAMPFFAPIPWEAEAFYHQPGMSVRNITLDWYPVGTGAFMLTDNNPNSRIVLARNPNFHGENYPTEGAPGDREEGFLGLAGQELPFLDEAVYILEKEAIPRWNKFLQGYYDASIISADQFDQAIQVDSQGNLQLNKEMLAREFKLTAGVDLSVFFLGFNMLDPIVGGYSERAQKLRRAISIAVDDEEYIDVFLNGRGIPAQGPIPPQVFGYLSGKDGINPYVYDWQDGHAVRKPIAEAKALLAEAGYANGINSQTGESLILNYDVSTTGAPDEKARFDWMRKQFEKIDIQLNVRSSLANRLFEKILNGSAQLFSWSWLADYPDPENFLFILAGENSTVKEDGPNRVNYDNPEYNALFAQMRLMPDNEERLAIIQQMLDIARRDAPWVWGYYPQTFTVTQSWLSPSKPSGLWGVRLKYIDLDPQKRAQLRRQWNIPIFWPVLIILGLLIIAFIPVIIQYWRKERGAR
ncbi:MAG: ABC transporter substrate-binding protein [Gammaproteobacteria bacterium]